MRTLKNSDRCSTILEESDQLVDSSPLSSGLVACDHNCDGQEAQFSQL